MRGRMLAMIALLICTVSYGASPAAMQMHASVNEYRAASGRSELALDETCCNMAQEWANHMARANSMYHGPNEQIIAYGYPNVQACVYGWQTSGPHNSWLLSNSSRAGWGYAVSQSGTPYWAGVFRGEVVVIAPENGEQFMQQSVFVRPRWRIFRFRRLR